MQNLNTMKRIVVNGQELIEGPVDGYKILNEDLTCRDMQFKIGMNELGNNNPLALCGNGIHFCEHPSGVWSYYSIGRVFKVRAYGVLPNGLNEPGADKKLVCKSIELVNEIANTGNRNTGDGNTGSWNTGNRNTGDLNTGNRNTGDCNTGNCNTGDLNTGNRNTGDCNTGNRNTGNLNTGNRNTGDCNTGNWNTGDLNTGNRNTGDCNTGNRNTGNNWSGHLNFGQSPVYMFNKKVKPQDVERIDTYLIYTLGELLKKQEPIDPKPFLSLPNASKAAIKRLHVATIEALSRSGSND
jgi:hypothetical protein